MPFSHHSHSGQFCGHAVNTLEEVVQNAIKKNFTTFCLTEHIHRDLADFYSEEQTVHTEQSLKQLFYDYIVEARRLQQKYASEIDIFVGFEGEWLHPAMTQQQLSLLQEVEWDLFVGSVHHLHRIPIDISLAEYDQARQVSGGTDERMCEDYFDAVYDMLQALKPPVVGHFDIIRLFWQDPTFSFRTWPRVWDKIVRNLKFIVEYGGVLELNAAGFRKERGDPFPGVEICKEFKKLGGCFTLTDDSHGVHHVGLDYDRVFESIREAGITELSCMTAVSETVKANDKRFPKVGWKTVAVEDLEGQVEELKKHFITDGVK